MFLISLFIYLFIYFFFLNNIITVKYIKRCVTINSIYDAFDMIYTLI